MASGPAQLSEKLYFGSMLKASELNWGNNMFKLFIYDVQDFFIDVNMYCYMVVKALIWVGN